MRFGHGGDCREPLAGCGSERSAWHWLGESSALGELLDVDFDSMSSMSLYRATDGLLKHRAAIEQHVFGRVRELFDLPTTVTLYDLTNTYLEGNAEQMPKAKFGLFERKAFGLPASDAGGGVGR